MKNLFLTLAFAFTTSLVCGQELFWYDIHLEIPIDQQQVAEDLITDFYSAAAIPEDVSASLSRLPLSADKETHILSFVSPSSKSLADFRSGLSGAKWDAYIAEISKRVISNRHIAGNALVTFNAEKSDPIGQVWIFKSKRKDVQKFASSFSKLNKTFNFPGFMAMGQITHGNSNGENTFIYATYEDLNAALTFGPKNDKEGAAFATFIDEIEDIEFSLSNTRVLVKQF